MDAPSRSARPGPSPSGAPRPMIARPCWRSPPRPGTAGTTSPRSGTTWVADEVGAFLVATAQIGPDGSPPADRDGVALAPGRVVGITHLALLTATEAWVEGIRVDPRVRGMDVATDLQAGVLEEARARGVTMVRYVTGEANEGSLRLGARVGLLPVGLWRFRGREREDDRVGPEGTAAVQAALDRAATDGVLLPPEAAADAGTWFARIAADPTFQAGHGLYEHRSWAAPGADGGRAGRAHPGGRGAGRRPGRGVAAGRC